VLVQLPATARCLGGVLATVLTFSPLMSTVVLAICAINSEVCQAMADTLEGVPTQLPSSSIEGNCSAVSAFAFVTLDLMSDIETSIVWTTLSNCSYTPPRWFAKSASAETRATAAATAAQVSRIFPRGSLSFNSSFSEVSAFSSIKSFESLSSPRRASSFMRTSAFSANKRLAMSSRGVTVSSPETPPSRD
jgi:hypothetical protein